MTSKRVAVWWWTTRNSECGDKTNKQTNKLHTPPALTFSPAYFGVWPWRFICLHNCYCWKYIFRERCPLMSAYALFRREGGRLLFWSFIASHVHLQVFHVHWWLAIPTVSWFLFFVMSTCEPSMSSDGQLFPLKTDSYPLWCPWMVVPSVQFVALSMVAHIFHINSAFSYRCKVLAIQICSHAFLPVLVSLPGQSGIHL